MEYHRHDHGRRDDVVDHGVFAQAAHAAVHLKHRAHSLCRVRQLGARHVLSCGPLLGAHFTANSVEVATGIFSRLPQIALTTVGSFLLVLSLLRGFGCIESLLRATKRVAFRFAHAIPQSAVVGSMCVGMVSGSGAANAITIGSATIPAMIASNIPPATAAAINPHPRSADN